MAEDQEQQQASGEDEGREDRKERMKEIEENPPDKLEDWPDDDLKYETFGGAEGHHSYEEGPEQQLGPSGLRHHEDGEVSIEGEKVDNPDEFKGEPIPGGPTDPDARGAETRGSGGDGDSDDDDGNGNGNGKDDEQA